jgi:hypothetical protein
MLPRASLAGDAHVARRRPEIPAGGRFDLILGVRKDAAGPQCPVGAFPKLAWDVLAAGFHVCHGAAAELGGLGELGLAQPGRTTIGGKLRA